MRPRRAFIEVIVLLRTMASISTDIARSRPETRRKCNKREFVIVAIVVTLGVLGFMDWNSRQSTLVKAPGVEIKKS